jgi:hypothetical protein
MGRLPISGDRGAGGTWYTIISMGLKICQQLHVVEWLDGGVEGGEISQQSP